MLDCTIFFLYNGLWCKWLVKLKNVRKNDWKLIIWEKRGERGWNKDVLGVRNRKINNQGWTIIRDPRVIGKCRSYQKFCLLWVGLPINVYGKKKQYSVVPFILYLKMCSFSYIVQNKKMCSFSYCTEKNTKEIIWPKRCYFFIKTRRSILKWHGSTRYLRQQHSIKQ